MSSHRSADQWVFFGRTERHDLWLAQPFTWEKNKLRAQVMGHCEVTSPCGHGSKWGLTGGLLRLEQIILGIHKVKSLRRRFWEGNQTSFCHIKDLQSDVQLKALLWSYLLLSAVLDFSVNWTLKITTIKVCFFISFGAAFMVSLKHHKGIISCNWQHAKDSLSWFSTGLFFFLSSLKSSLHAVVTNVPFLVIVMC